MQASRAANAGGRVDILEGEMQTSRRQLNANMDHMIPHDGSLLSMAHHQNFGNSGEYLPLIIKFQDS